jgi:hypothetical protein
MAGQIPDSKHLENSGFFVHRPDGYVLPDERTFVVLGLPRGGTTMVSKALSSMGVFMGAAADNAVGEDTTLADAIESGDKRSARKIIDGYNSAHATWGFKRPNIVNHLDAVGVEFRNPHYVVVMRDLLAIANRNRLSTFKDPFKDMRESIASLDTLVGFIETNTDDPMFLLSYERVLARPRPFAIAFSEFCGIDLDAKAVRSFLHAVTPDENYLESSRSDTFMGRVTGAGETTVSGYFRYNHSDDRPPLELFVNDEPVDSDVRWSFIELNRPNGKTYRGDHAFDLTLTDRRSFDHGDRIVVVAEGRRRQQLRNCPYRVKLRKNQA